MMKFSALNESSLSDDDGDPDLATKEAQEEEAYTLYQSALRKQYESQLEEAEEMFKELLEMEFLTDAQPREDDDEEEEENAPLGPALTLKYLVYKNLASICKEKKDYSESVAFYLEALEIDKSDVMMWYHMGKASIEIINYPLARLSFEEGLKCSPNHWPSLDSVISVMYTLNDYANCLYYIAQALEREPYYLKGLALKDQMYKEDPSLKSFCDGYFKKCDPSVHSADYNKEEAEQFVQECLALREKKRSLCKPEPSPVLSLGIPITQYTWKNVGESLVNVYDRIANADPFVSFTCKIDLSPYMETSSKPSDINSDKTTETSPLSSLSEANSSNSVASVTSLKPTELCTPLAPTSQAVSEMEVDENSEIKNQDPVLLPLVEPAPSSDLSTCNDSTSSVRKPAKRKRNEFAELSEFVCKRRSSRVRNPTIKRPLDNTNYQELLHKFLPSRLIGDGKFEQDYDSDHLSQDKSSNDFSFGGSEREKKDLTGLFSSLEKEEVSNFITKNQTNGGIIDLLYRYVTILASKSNMTWPKDLIEVYCNAFSRLRNHITTPNLFSSSVESFRIKDEGFAILVFSEFKIDQWHRSTGNSMPFSLKTSPSSLGVRCDRIGDDFYSDMEFLVQLPSRSDILGEDWLNYSARALWLKAKFHSLEGEIDLAVSCMRKLYGILSDEVGRDLKIVIQNCEDSSVINIGNVQQQLEALQRCQSLEEVQKLYEHSDYAAVVDLLVLTFSQPRSSRKQTLEGVPERHAQLLYLQNSLIKLERYKECVYWSEVAFNEALQQFMNATKNAEWSETMAQLLSGLDKCAKIDSSYLSDLEESKLIRLTQNLILVIVIQMENYDFAGDNAALLVVLPWIILYRMILNEEKKNKSKTEEGADKGKSTSMIANDFLTDTDLNSAMPSSLMLLFAAHEYLGRRYWCTTSDGLLLLTFMDIIMAELQDTSGNSALYREDLETGIEQCIYCLYGHPNKRSRAKHLTEHSTKPITLTWERACFIFDYFKPNILPEFDSYRTSTISAELECLFKRISALVPTEEDPTTRVDAYTAYIEGGTDKCPDPPFRHKKLSNIVQDLYYLMGDYYFKNKEFNKAIRYYLYDICINPDRQDSWAGMALSRSAQLEQKLNSYELKNESTVYRKSSAALRCFEHALELDPTTTSLWIEYGSLAYILHSHASRQLKQETFSEELHDLLKKKEREMLEIAERCFRAANRCDDGGEPEEAWLHHYILGKVSEKKGEGPAVYLDHFKKALNYLHEDFARYPQKILYHNPAELSIEALEVYYRVHASCLKFLWKRELTGCDMKTIKVIQQCLHTIKSSPFYNFQEKCRTEIAASSSNAASETEDAQPTQNVDCESEPKPSEPEPSPSQSKADHDYYSNVDKEVKKICEDSRGSRPSTDSLPESPEFMTIKEVLESLIGVVVEIFVDEAKIKSAENSADVSICVESKPDLSKLVVESAAEESVYTSDVPMEGTEVLEPESGVVSSSPMEITEVDELSKLQEIAEELERKSASHEEIEMSENIVSESGGKLKIDEADAVESKSNTSDTCAPTGNDDEVLMSLSSILSSLEAVKKIEVEKDHKTYETEPVNSSVEEAEMSIEEKTCPKFSSNVKDIKMSIYEENDPRVSSNVEEIQMSIGEENDPKVSANDCDSSLMESTSVSVLEKNSSAPKPKMNAENDIQCMEISTSDSTVSNVSEQQNSPNVKCQVELLSTEDKEEVQNTACEENLLSTVSKKELSVPDSNAELPKTENKDELSKCESEEKLPNHDSKEELPCTDRVEELSNADCKEEVPSTDSIEELPNADCKELPKTESEGLLKSRSVDEVPNVSIKESSKAVNEEKLPDGKDLPKYESNDESPNADTKQITEINAIVKSDKSVKPTDNEVSSSSPKAPSAGNQSKSSCASKDKDPSLTVKVASKPVKEKTGPPPPTSEELKKSKSEIVKLVPKCLDAMRECLHRFPQHYKALYRLAHYYCHSNTNQNLQWAREILLAATPATKKFSPLAGLFAERKNTNFFNGIWRAPSNEIDRAGSFGAHMYRSVLLLIEVLYQQQDYNMMVHLTQQLYRTPDLGKKYMRDTDRVFLVRKAYDACVNILRDKMNTLLQEEPPPEESQLICCLLEIYRTCLTLWKAGINVNETNDLLEEAYTMYRIGEVDSHPSVLEQATKFCQIQLSKTYPPESSKQGSSSKYSNIPEVSILQSSSAASNSSYNADAWQKDLAETLMMPTLTCEVKTKPDAKTQKPEPKAPKPESVLAQESIPQLTPEPPTLSRMPSNVPKSPNNEPLSPNHVPINPPTLLPSPLIPSQMVHVEKPKAENLQACSVAYLPASPAPPTFQTPPLLSCQAYECFDVLSSIMQASGYQVAPRMGMPQAFGSPVNPYDFKSQPRMPGLQRGYGDYPPRMWSTSSRRKRRRSRPYKAEGLPRAPTELGLNLSKETHTKPIVSTTLANSITNLQVDGVLSQDRKPHIEPAQTRPLCLVKPKSSNKRVPCYKAKAPSPPKVLDLTKKSTEQVTSAQCSVIVSPQEKSKVSTVSETKEKCKTTKKEKRILTDMLPDIYDFTDDSNLSTNLEASRIEKSAKEALKFINTNVDDSAVSDTVFGLPMQKVGNDKVPQFEIQKHSKQKRSKDFLRDQLYKKIKLAETGANIESDETKKSKTQAVSSPDLPVSVVVPDSHDKFNVNLAKESTSVILKLGDVTPSLSVPKIPERDAVAKVNKDKENNHQENETKQTEKTDLKLTNLLLEVVDQSAQTSLELVKDNATEEPTSLEIVVDFKTASDQRTESSQTDQCSDVSPDNNGSKEKETVDKLCQAGVQIEQPKTESDDMCLELLVEENKADAMSVMKKSEPKTDDDGNRAETNECKKEKTFEELDEPCLELTVEYSTENEVELCADDYSTDVDDSLLDNAEADQKDTNNTKEISFSSVLKDSSSNFQIGSLNSIKKDADDSSAIECSVILFNESINDLSKDKKETLEVGVADESERRNQSGDVKPRKNSATNTSQVPLDELNLVSKSTFSVTPKTESIIIIRRNVGNTSLPSCQSKTTVSQKDEKQDVNTESETAKGFNGASEITKGFNEATDISCVSEVAYVISESEKSATDSVLDVKIYAEKESTLSPMTTKHECQNAKEQMVSMGEAAGLRTLNESNVGIVTLKVHDLEYIGEEKQISPTIKPAPFQLENKSEHDASNEDCHPVSPKNADVSISPEKNENESNLEDGQEFVLSTQESSDLQSDGKVHILSKEKGLDMHPNDLMEPNLSVNETVNIQPAKEQCTLSTNNPIHINFEGEKEYILPCNESIKFQIECLKQNISAEEQTFSAKSENIQESFLQANKTDHVPLEETEYILSTDETIIVHPTNLSLGGEKATNFYVNESICADEREYILPVDEPKSILPEIDKNLPTSENVCIPEEECYILPTVSNVELLPFNEPCIKTNDAFVPDIDEAYQKIVYNINEKESDKNAHSINVSIHKNILDKNKPEDSSLLVRAQNVHSPKQENSDFLLSTDSILYEDENIIILPKQPESSLSTTEDCILSERDKASSSQKDSNSSSSSKLKDKNVLYRDENIRIIATYEDMTDESTSEDDSIMVENANNTLHKEKDKNLNDHPIAGSSTFQEDKAIKPSDINAKNSASELTMQENKCIKISSDHSTVVPSLLQKKVLTPSNKNGTHNETTSFEDDVLSYKGSHDETTSNGEKSDPNSKTAAFSASSHKEAFPEEKVVLSERKPMADEKSESCPLVEGENLEENVVLHNSDVSSKSIGGGLIGEEKHMNTAGKKLPMFSFNQSSSTNSAQRDEGFLNKDEDSSFLDEELLLKINESLASNDGSTTSEDESLLLEFGDNLKSETGQEEALPKDHSLKKCRENISEDWNLPIDGITLAGNDIIAANNNIIINEDKENTSQAQRITTRVTHLPGNVISDTNCISSGCKTVFSTIAPRTTAVQTTLLENSTIVVESSNFSKFSSCNKDSETVPLEECIAMICGDDSLTDNVIETVGKNSVMFDETANISNIESQNISKCQTFSVKEAETPVTAILILMNEHSEHELKGEKEMADVKKEKNPIRSREPNEEDKVMKTNINNPLSINNATHSEENMLHQDPKDTSLETKTNVLEVCENVPKSKNLESGSKQFLTCQNVSVPKSKTNDPVEDIQTGTGLLSEDTKDCLEKSLVDSSNPLKCDPGFCKDKSEA